MKGTFFTKKRIIAGVIVLAAVLLASGGVALAKYWDKLNDPMSLFNSATTAPTTAQTQTPQPATSEPAESPTATDSATEEPTATPTLNPYDELDSQADKSLMKDTINICLIGVDYSEERANNKKQYVGKNFNSDVMLVLAINFKKNTVDMISVPRDSYAKIANIDGIYKLNFSLAAGGGINNAGFMNVCKSVQGVLGGDKIPPINYYIAVTMPMVKSLTDAIGGVDYDMDVNFTINGRSYKKGMQHLDGQAVLDYCRVRKGALSAQPGDLNRVNRQKKMLLAVFKKLQNTSTILKVPQILSSMKDQVYTNLNFNQLAALAVFGAKLPTDDITMHTIPGYYAYGIFNKNYVLLDQTKRVAMIKEIYGVTVPQLYKYSPSYSKMLWAYMQAESWLKDVNTVLLKDAKLKDKKKLTDAVKMEQLNTEITATRDLMKKYKSRLYRSAKPGFSQAEYEGMQQQASKLKSLASGIFTAAGYKVNWFVDIYKPGQMRMKE